MAWLISNNLMNSLCSQEPEVASLVGISLDGEQSVPSNGNLIQQAYCAPDKMTAFSRLSRFGMTYKPLTESRGEELLTLFREDFRAKTFPQRGGGLASKEKEAECGDKWQGSFTKYDPNSCSWKTHQCLLVGDLDEFSETWPQWGLMQDGECWEQIPLDLPTTEPEFGWLPTPIATDWKGGCSAIRKDKGKPRTDSIRMYIKTKFDITYPHPNFLEALMDWPLGWTELKPLVTDKFPCVQQQHGES